MAPTVPCLLARSLTDASVLLLNPLHRFGGSSLLYIRRQDSLSFQVLSVHPFIAQTSSSASKENPIDWYSKMGKTKIVMKVSMENPKKRSKALKSAVGSAGVMSASLDGDKIVVEGDGIDSVALTITLRRRMGFAELVSVAPVDEKKEEKKSSTVQPVPMPYCYQVVSSYPYQYPDPYYSTLW